LEGLLAALERLGYYKVNPEQKPCLKWRRAEFHVVIRLPRERRKTTTLHIHRDKPISIQPYHHVIHYGPLIRRELNHIVETYETEEKE